MDEKTLNDILGFLCDTLGGDWLLTGGALVRLEFDPARGTEDVDLLRLAHPDLSEEASREALFRWLLARGLGPEWVNTAVEPFVREVPGWRRETVLLRAGAKGAVHRPNLTLFAYLKLRRGTETDLGDIRSAIRKCPEGFDERKLLSWPSEAVRERFARAREDLGL